MEGQATADYCEAVPDDVNAGASNATAEMAAPSMIDLDAIEADLASVEVALNRLEAGTYWTDEVTGDTLPTDLLEQNPLVRRLAR